MIALLLSALVSLTTSQSNYVCGVEGNQYFSAVPCPQTCANGGFKLFVGCQDDYTCELYSPSAVCIDQCCCSPPIAGQAPYPYNTLFLDASSSLSLMPSMLIVCGLTILGLN